MVWRCISVLMLYTGSVPKPSEQTLSAASMATSKAAS